jgi:hypothetical protein
MKNNRFNGVSLANFGVVLAVMILTCGTAQGQQMFDTPQAALDGLKAAIQAKDKDALRQVFGPQVEDLKSGDPVEDAADLDAFASRLKSAASLEEAGPEQMTLLVGRDEHPFAVPLVRRDGKWFFDTAAGKEELLNRRIGQNELQAISVCRGYVAAQREYYLLDPDNTGLPHYAQRLASTPGKHDGLYWDTNTDETPSPLGPLVAEAQAEGYGKDRSGQAGQPSPYHGYVYKILTQQGKAAPGGAFKYVVNGNMVGGFALVAWPISWGSSGIVTFLVGPSGRIYQKDLGNKTDKIAAKIKEFSPDETWTLVKE